MPRRTLYTSRGIARVPCFRCDAPSRFQWNICADGNVQRGFCGPCDVAMNDLVLRWCGDPDVEAKMAAYRAKIAA